MQIQSVEFHRAAYRSEDVPRDGRPQFAFVGKSNVGKSTLINSVLGRKNVARVSQTPGKTQAIHFYLVNRKIYFVDLPGYGYAKVSKSMRQGWEQLMRSYFEGAEDLRLLFLLIDSRRGPSEEDEAMLDLAAEVDLPVQLVLTKSDKLSRGQLARSVMLAARQLETEKASLVTFSKENRQGVDAIWRSITGELQNLREQGRVEPHETTH